MPSSTQTTKALDALEGGKIHDTRAQDVVLDPAPTRRMRRRILVGAGLGALALTVGLILLFRSWASTSLVVPLERVRIATVSRGTFVRDIAAQGTVVVANSPTLFAPAIGTVTFVVDAGHSVTKGEVLATIDSPSLRNEFARERALLDGLIVALERAKVEARRRILKSKQAADLAASKSRAAERELERMQDAWNSRVIPQRDLDRAQDQRDDADLEHKHALTNAKLLEDSLNFQLKTKSLEIDRQRLAVADLERRVEALTVKSPVNGMVGNLAVSQSATVAENAGLLTVVDLSALEVEFRVPESYAVDLAPDMHAEIRYGDRKFRGHVISISPEVQQSEVKGRLRFDDKLPPGVRQNQRLNVRIMLDQRDNVLKVERGSFVDAGSYAYVVEGDSATLRSIGIGAMSVSEVEIVSGLKEGDRIVISNVADFAREPHVRLAD